MFTFCEPNMTRMNSFVALIISASGSDPGSLWTAMRIGRWKFSCPTASGRSRPSSGTPPPSRLMMGERSRWCGLMIASTSPEGVPVLVPMPR